MMRRQSRPKLGEEAPQSGVGRVVSASATYSPEQRGHVASPRPTPILAASCPGIHVHVGVAVPRLPQPEP